MLREILNREDVKDDMRQLLEHSGMKCCDCLEFFLNKCRSKDMEVYLD